MEFGEIKDAVMLGLMFVVFGVPALAIAARIAIRPVLDAVNSFREVAGRPTAADPRVAELEAEVARLSREVNRLAEAEAFNRQLAKGASPEDTRG